MAADWPSTGAVPVFVGDLEHNELVGFTSFTLPREVGTFHMSKPIEGDPHGAFAMQGQALVIERDTGGGSYLAWLVVDGDPRDLPDFWPA
jgi:hypothetical protein